MEATVCSDWHGGHLCCALLHTVCTSPPTVHGGHGSLSRGAAAHGAPEACRAGGGRKCGPAHFSVASVETQTRATGPHDGRPCYDNPFAEACFAAGYPVGTAAAAAVQAIYTAIVHDRRSLLGSPLLFSSGATSVCSLAANGDGSSGIINLPGSFTLFGTTRSALYVNNNGGVSFNGPIGSFTPFSLIENSRNGQTMFYAYFGDVDTRGGGTLSWYASGDAGVLSTAQALVASEPLDWVFVATWNEVGYYNTKTNKRNTFQLVLARALDDTAYLCYQYLKLEWTTGDALGGSNGLGGSPARAGYSDGVGNALELPSSGTAGVLNLVWGSNGGRAPGRYCFGIGSPIANACATNNGDCDPLTSCTNSANGPVCGSCPAGYTGTGRTGCTQVAAVNPCASNPCQDNGVCSASSDSFTRDCSATTDFTGDLCQTRINDCASNPCQSGGSYTDGDRSYTCDCSQTSDSLVPTARPASMTAPATPARTAARALRVTAPTPATAPRRPTSPAATARPASMTAPANPASALVPSKEHSTRCRLAHPYGSLRVWKTPSSGVPSGTCQVLVMRFVDGTET